MRKISKGLIVWLVVLAMLISLCPMSIVMATDSYVIVGDSEILLPKYGAIKLQYTLAADLSGTAISETASYAVVDKTTGENSVCEKYAYIDSATGMLYVSSEGVGKTLTIKASIDSGVSYPYTLDVELKDGFYFDFEDETVGGIVTNSKLGQIKSTAYNASHATDAYIVAANGGKAVESLYDGTGAYRVALAPGSIAPSKYTIEADMSFNKDANWKKTRFLALKYKGATALSDIGTNQQNETWYQVVTSFTDDGDDTNDVLKFKWKGSSSQWGQDGGGSNGNGDMSYTIGSYIPFKLVVTDNKTATLSVNDVEKFANHKIYGVEQGLNLGNIDYIGFPAHSDNIQFYSGEKVDITVSALSSSNVYFNSDEETAVVKLANVAGVAGTSIEFKDMLTYTADNGSVTVDGNTLYVPKGVSSFELSAANEELKASSSQTITCHNTGIKEALAANATLTPSMSGYLLARFKTENALRLKLNGSTTITAPAPSAMAEGVIAIDTQNKEYYAVFDNKFVGSDAFADASLTSVENEGGAISEFALTSMVKTKPFAINPKITGASAVGLPLTADFSYYSPYGALEGAHSYEWLVSESENGSYSPIATTKEWTPDESYAEYWVKAKITLKDTNGYAATTFETPAQFIKDVFAINLTSGNLNLEVQNVLANTDGSKDSNVYVMISSFKGGTVAGTTVEKLSFPNANDALIKNYTIDSAIDGVKVSLIDEDGFTPIGVSKLATIGSGTVPDYSVASDAASLGVSAEGNTIMVKEASSGVASLMVLDNKGTDSDKSSYWWDMQRISDIYTAADSGVCSDGIIWAENIALSSGETTAFTLPTLPKGSYRVVLTKADGTTEEAYILSEKAELLKSAVMKEPGFKKALELYIASDAALDADSAVKALSDNGRAMTEKLIKADNYDFNKIFLNAKLIGYLEGSAPGGAAYTEIKSLLESNSLATKGIDLMQKDANKAATAKAVLSGGWTSAKTLTDSIRDLAIRYGVAHVVNNDEAHVFLNELTDTNYPTSEYKSAIRDLVGGTLYNTMTDLKNAINGYKPSGGGSGGGGGSMGGGSGSGGGGSMGGGSGVNPGPDTVVVPSIPSVDTSKKVFGDVPTSHWAAEHIDYLVENKILAGFPDGSFRPEQAILRSEFVKLICTAFKLTSETSMGFADVADSAWYAPYTSICASLGIVKGDGTYFMPEREITREEAATMIHRAMAHVGYELPEGKGGLLDQAEISDYASESVKSLVALGLISGMEDGRFYPFDSMTRAQCAKIIALAMRG